MLTWCMRCSAHLPTFAEQRDALELLLQPAFQLFAQENVVRLISSGVGLLALMHADGNPPVVPATTREDVIQSVMAFEHVARRCSALPTLSFDVRARARVMLCLAGASAHWPCLQELVARGFVDAEGCVRSPVHELSPRMLQIVVPFLSSAQQLFDPALQTMFAPEFRAATNILPHEYRLYVPHAQADGGAEDERGVPSALTAVADRRRWLVHVLDYRCAACCLHCVGARVGGWASCGSG
jgi:hypothetical protein